MNSLIGFSVCDRDAVVIPYRIADLMPPPFGAGVMPAALVR